MADDSTPAVYPSRSARSTHSSSGEIDANCSEQRGGILKMRSPGSRDWVFAGDDPVLTRTYIKALSLAFMQTYIGDRPQYQAMLTAAYAKSINQEPLRLNLVRSLTFKQLEQAYGEPPPLPLTPT